MRAASQCSNPHVLPSPDLAPSAPWPSLRSCLSPTAAPQGTKGGLDHSHVEASSPHNPFVPRALAHGGRLRASNASEKLGACFAAARIHTVLPHCPCFPRRRSARLRLALYAGSRTPASQASRPAGSFGENASHYRLPLGVNSARCFAVLESTHIWQVLCFPRWGGSTDRASACEAEDCRFDSGPRLL